MQVSRAALLTFVCGLSPAIPTALGEQLTDASAAASVSTTQSLAEASAGTSAARVTAQDTLQEFQQICEGVRQSRELFYGTAQIEALRAKLQSPGLSPADQVTGRDLLAGQMLRIGNPAEAVRLLEEARKLTAEYALGAETDVKLLLKIGLADLRAGEISNCIQMHTPDMCLLPIRPGGQHKDRAGALAAMDALKIVVERAPGSFTGQWLLNIAAMTLGQWPDGVPEAFRVPPERLQSTQDIGRFPEIAHHVGLHLYDNAGGAAMDDFDGDGMLDIVTSSMNPCVSMHYFHNDGKGGFEDRTVASGLDGQLGGLNLVHADYDNDGDLDILVLRGGWMGPDGCFRKSLLSNDGAGHFVDVTHKAGLATPAYPTQTAAWADIDLDGDLDLFVGHEDQPKRGTNYPSQLFRNNGDGTFTDIALAAGVAKPGFVKGVTWGDYDNDGDPDLYTSCIGPNHLYRNNGDGSFTDVAPELEVTGPPARSFPTWFFDYDNDGNLDIFVADYNASVEEIAANFLRGVPSPHHPWLYHNEGNGHFREVSGEVGLTEPSLPMGSNYGDLDNDGFPDIYLGTGDPNYETLTPNLMYRNDGGRRFVDVTYSGGFGHLQKGHAIAFGDLDNDGDQDIFEKMGGAFPGDMYHSVLYENPGQGHAWVTLRLVGVRSNRGGIGARIRIQTQAPTSSRSIHALVGSGGSFGDSSLQQELGLGDATRIEALEVLWPGSHEAQVFRDVAVNSVYEVREGASELKLIPVTPVPLRSAHTGH